MSGDWARVAETVKRRRTDLGLSQRAAALRAGLSPTTWGQLETHAQKIDDLTKPKVARALNWTTDSIDRLLAGEEPTVDPDAKEPATIEEVDDRLSRLEARFDSMEEKIDRLIRAAGTAPQSDAPA